MSPAESVSSPVHAALRVFVVEDDDLMREMVCEALGGEAGVTVVGQAANPADALAGLATAEANVALMDLGLGRHSGTELIRQVMALYPSLHIMAHTVFDDRNAIFNAIKAGAKGYVLKGLSGVELAAALRELQAGGAPMTPSVARLVIQELAGQGTPDPLSPRERQILRHIDAGLTYKEIAATENVSSHTVHSHIKNIYERLHASGKRDALAKARQHGML